MPHGVKDKGRKLHFPMGSIMRSIPVISYKRNFSWQRR